jgi:ribonuclease BN (tRNA processing enzyme)
MALLKANWMKERTTMKIFGPAGTKLWLERLFEAYSYLKDRIDLKIKELSDDGLIRLGKDIIICRSVEHGPDALAYKVVSEDVSVVYSGDTQPCRAIAELSTGADLLIHECNFLTKDMRGIKGHSNPFTIGDVYANIGVKKLALVHLPPRIQEYREQVLKTVEKYFDEIIIGEDLLTLEL